MVVVLREWFGEQVCKIISGGNLLKKDLFRLDKFPEVMVAYVNMLDLAVILRILCECNCPPAISHYNTRHLVLDLYFI